MEKSERDEEMIRQMLDWLDRRKAENFAEGHACAELVLTDADCEFLRGYGIAVP